MRSLYLFLFTILFVNISLQAEDVLLRYKFAPGQVVQYEVSMHDEYDIRIGGSSDEPYSRQDSGKSYRVIAVNDDGSAVLEPTFDWIKIDVEQNGVRSTWDSRKGVPPPMELAAMADVVGKPNLRISVTPTGEVTKVESLLGDQIEVDVDDPKQAALDVFLRLPQESVEIGGTWREDFQGSVNVDPNVQLKKVIKMQRRYYLKSVEDGIATIQLRTVVLTPVQEPAQLMQLLRRQPQGTIKLDLDRGILISKSLAQQNQVQNFVPNQASVLTFKQQHTEIFKGVQTAATVGPPVR